MAETSIEAGDTILVTGATGFVGSAVLRALTALGVRLRVLVRGASNRTNLDGVECDVAVGDMTDPESVARAVDGARYLFHVAADYRLWARDPSAILRANLDGTRTVMEAAQAARVEKIVYTSSVATLRAGRTVIDESHPLAEGEGIGAYKNSNVAAERLVESMVEHGLPAVIVMPSTPIGPRDIKPTPTGRIVVEAAAGHIPAFVDTGLNLAHVDDIARGHVLALERGTVGERYILGGQDASLRQLLTEIAELTGRRAPRVGLPRAPLYPLAIAAEAWARVTGREPLVTRDALNMAAHRMFFTSAKAERDLGYTARPYREALIDALAWFRATGYLE